MSRFNRSVDWHRARPFWALGLHLAAVAALLGAALIAQYAYNLQPCVLCLWQRIPYGVIALIALLGFLAPARFVPVLIAVIGAVYAGEAALAFYHVGVEQHWWASAAGCGFNGQTASSTAELYERIKNAPTTPCDAVAWQFLGLSMAGWNVIVALCLAALSAVQWAVLKPWSSTTR